MTISLKIFISKDETEKIILLDEPIVLNNCQETPATMFVKSVSVFWNYNNLHENIHYYTYDNIKINFKDGYYTFNTLKTELENVGAIELEQIEFSRKCTIQSDETLNLQTFGPIIGFSENKVIQPNTLTESENVLNSNNLEYVNISCNMIDKSKNFVNGKRSNVLIQIPIESEQTLKGSVSKIYPPEETGGIKLSNGIYNELIFKVEGNHSSSIGNVLLEIIIK